jgi:hypothetical protein
MALFFDINPLLNAIADKVAKGATITLFFKKGHDDTVVNELFLRVTSNPDPTYLEEPLLATLKVLDSPPIEVIIHEENLDKLSPEYQQETPLLINELQEAFLSKLSFYYSFIGMDETDFIVQINYQIKKQLPIKNFINLKLFD